MELVFAARKILCEADFQKRIIANLKNLIKKGAARRPKI